MRELSSQLFQGIQALDSLYRVPNSLTATAPSRRDPQSTGHLDGSTLFVQKVAAMHQTKTQLTQNKAMGSYLGAGKVFAMEYFF